MTETWQKIHRFESQFNFTETLECHPMSSNEAFSVFSFNCLLRLSWLSLYLTYKKVLWTQKSYRLFCYPTTSCRAILIASHPVSLTSFSCLLSPTCMSKSCISFSAILLPTHCLAPNPKARDLNPVPSPLWPCSLLLHHRLGSKRCGSSNTSALLPRG